MIKLMHLVMTLIFVIIFSGQSNANEMQTLFGISKIIKSESDELLDQSWTEIKLSEELAVKYPKLYQSMVNYSNDLHDKAMERQRKYREESLSLKQESPENFRSFYDRNDIIIRRADSNVLSLLEMSADYFGGVHGMYGYFGVNFDTTTGKRLVISDVCNNAKDLLNAIIMRLHEDYAQSPFENADNYIMKNIVEDKINFTIEYDSISFYFNPYEIGSYAEGLFTATLMFKDYPNLFKTKYTNKPNAYCQTLPLYGANIVSFKNGMRNYVQIYINDNGFFKVLTSGGTAEDISGLKDLKPPVLVHTSNDKNYLYIDGYIENEGRRLHVYNISDDKLELIWVLPYTFKNMADLKYETWWLWTNPDNIQFDSMKPIGNMTSHFGAINGNGSISLG